MFTHAQYPITPTANRGTGRLRALQTGKVIYLWQRGNNAFAAEVRIGEAGAEVVRATSAETRQLLTELLSHALPYFEDHTEGTGLARRVVRKRELVMPGDPCFAYAFMQAVERAGGLAVSLTPLAPSTRLA
jgi:hypothetical protein